MLGVVVQKPDSQQSDKWYTNKRYHELRHGFVDQSGIKVIDQDYRDKWARQRKGIFVCVV